MCEIVARKAEEKGLSPDEYIILLMENELNVEERERLYLVLHEKYLSEAEEYAGKGDITQACEKYWGSVTALLNTIAVRRGWRHYSHRDYSEIVERLSGETGDLELPKLFAVAERLHANYYHGFIRAETFPAYRESVKRIVGKLKRLL